MQSTPSSLRAPECNCNLPMTYLLQITWFRWDAICLWVAFRRDLGDRLISYAGPVMSWSPSHLSLLTIARQESVFDTHTHPHTYAHASKHRLTHTQTQYMLSQLMPKHGAFSARRCTDIRYTYRYSIKPPELFKTQLSCERSHPTFSAPTQTGYN